MLDESKAHPKQILQPNWRKQTLNLFNDALCRYEQKLLKYKRPGNTQIEHELKKIHIMKSHIKSYWQNGEDELDLITLPMDAQSYGFLYDIYYKYYSGKKQELEEAKRTTLIEAALEGQAQEVENINEVLHAPIWETVERQKILVNSLYIPKDVPLQSGNIPYTQQTINGNVYGQVIGTNVGHASQSVFQDSLVTLQELFELVKERSDLPANIKADAIGDIQTIQSQLLKPKPDKSILDKVIESLSILADSVQVGQFALYAAPLIQKFLDHLP